MGRLFLLWCLVWARPAVSSEITEELYVASPQAGAVLRAGIVPVLVRVPVAMRFHTAQLFLDGTPLETVPTVIRRRWWEGKGVDLIASFPSADLTPGWHTLGVVLHAPRLGRFEQDEDRGGEWSEVERRFKFAPRAGRLNVKIVDQHGEPRSARIDVFDSKGKPVVIGNRQDANADPSLRDVPRHGFFVGRTGAVEFLKPGTYTLLASGGLRDGVERKTVSIVGAQNLTLTVPRLFETPEEWSADLHVHTAYSSDSFIPDAERFQALVAAGIDVAVVTEHNRVRDPVPALELLKMEDSVKTIPGAEFRIGLFKHSIGHVNAFPMRPNRAVPVLGDASPAEVMGILRRDHQAHPPKQPNGPFLIQLNHPRGIQFQPDKSFREDAHALFEELNFDPTLSVEQQSDERARARDPDSGASMLDFDTIEVLNRFSIQAWLRVRKDWFALLNRGLHITGTGNADSHTAQLERMGFPMNLVEKGDGSLSDFLRSILDGRVRVSSGPLVDLIVNVDEQRITPSHGLVPVADKVTATIRVRAAPWVPVPMVRLVQNGQVVFSSKVGELGPDMSKEWTVELAVDEDSWLLAEAGWPLKDMSRPTGTYAEVAPGHVPIGFTNPIWLDENKDGVWTPTEVSADQAPQ